MRRGVLTAVFLLVVAGVTFIVWPDPEVAPRPEPVASRAAVAPARTTSIPIPAPAPKTSTTDWEHVSLRRPEDTGKPIRTERKEEREPAPSPEPPPPSRSVEKKKPVAKAEKNKEDKNAIVRVVDPNGKPLRGATVRVRDDRKFKDGDFKPVAVATDENGDASLGELPEKITFRGSATHARWGKVEFDVKAGDKVAVAFDSRIGVTGTIRGRLAVNRGEIPDDVEVVVWDTRDGSETPFRIEDFTTWDASKREFTIDVEARAWRIRAQAIDWSPSDTYEVLVHADAESRAPELVITAAGSIKGVVEMPRSLRRGEREVLELELYRDADQRPAAFTVVGLPIDDAGAFRIGGIAGGKYQARVRTERHVGRWIELAVWDGHETADVRLTLEARDRHFVVARGRVVERSGAAVGQATVRAGESIAVTDSSGEFTIRAEIEAHEIQAEKSGKRSRPAPIDMFAHVKPDARPIEVMID